MSKLSLAARQAEIQPVRFFFFLSSHLSGRSGGAAFGRVYGARAQVSHGTKMTC